MTWLYASFGLWFAWLVSWGLAAFWSKTAVVRAPMLEEAAHRVPTVIGYVLIFVSARTYRMDFDYHGVSDKPLWIVGDGVGWALTACVALGFVFCWWARITLGALWSGSVQRKQGHQIIEAGPYGLVRHPIYTGMLFSTAAIAIQIGTPAALVGLVLATFGLWLKGRIEERFLSQQLGEAAYADYRRRTPMLVPFWPLRG